MTTLKEETIKGIQSEEAFNMSKYGELKQLSRLRKNKPKNSCGTACCIAGHIVSAAARLGRAVPKMSEVSDYRKVKGEFTYTGNGKALMDKLGLDDPEDEVARAARVLWARSQGVEEANRLDFDHWGTFTDLDLVTADMAVQHLNGKDSVQLAVEEGILNTW